MKEEQSSLAAESHPTARDTQRQYDRQAAHYAESSVHRVGQSLDDVRRLATPSATDVAVDVGTGVGFTAFLLAPDVARMVALDLTPGMLGQARGVAAERGLEQRVDFALGLAERLPFADDSLSLLTCRLSSHHFHDLAAALLEMTRVVRHDGRIVLCDVVAPEPPGIDDLMNELERLRDPTHVWNYRVSQWQQELLPAAGLKATSVITGKSSHVFSDWVERAGTPPGNVAALGRLFRTETARQAFDVREDGEELFFRWDVATILAVRA